MHAASAGEDADSPATEGAMVEEELRQAAAAVFEAGWDALAVVEPADDGDLVVARANERFLREFGFAAGEGCCARRCSEVYPREQVGDVVERVRAALKAGQPLHYEVVRELPERRYVLRGLVVPLDTTRAALVVRDVSEETEARRQIEELEELAGIGFWYRNMLDDTVLWSRGYRRVLGLADDEPASLDRLLDVVHPDDAERVREGLRRATTTDYPGLEFRVVWPDGQVRTVERRIELAHDDTGRLVRVFGTLQDVTRQREAQARQRQLEDVRRRQHQAVELNDEVVQGLVTAWLALELGRSEEAAAAVRQTTRQAQRMASDLLAATRTDRGITPGSLARSEPSNADAADRSEPPPPADPHGHDGDQP